MEQIRLWFGSIELIVTAIGLVLFLGAFLFGRLSLRGFPWWHR